jgi:hypothetical protein
MRNHDGVRGRWSRRDFLHEFEGGHMVDQSLAEAALAWAATP